MKKFARIWASSALSLCPPPLVASVPIAAAHGQPCAGVDCKAVTICSDDCRGEGRLGECGKWGPNPSRRTDTASGRRWARDSRAVFPGERHDC